MNDSCDEDMDDDENFEFVPKSWLFSWLADPVNAGPVETKHFLCVHGNLDIDRLSDMKICDHPGVSRLVEEFGQGEGPRLTTVRSLVFPVILPTAFLSVL